MRVVALAAPSAAPVRARPHTASPPHHAHQPTTAHAAAGANNVLPYGNAAAMEAAPAPEVLAAAAAPPELEVQVRPLSPNTSSRQRTTNMLLNWSWD